jgi:phosphoglycolate phosphatase-like HAD superfamily hydrolase
VTIDALVFDVDGVLVDTDASYTEAVIRTLALVASGTPIDRGLLRLWRRSGDWNNDWDLCYGLYCWLNAPVRLDAATAAGRSLAELRTAAPGVELAYRDVQGIFEEHYNGTAATVARYGVAPRIHNERPLALDERVLLEPALIGELRALGIAKLGVVTGRVRADWDQVAARIPLPPGLPVATDEDGRKPDPAPLRAVIDALAPRGVAVVGDTLNDLRMTQAYRRVGTVPAVCVIRCDADERDAYLRAGAAATIEELGELPAALRSVMA